MRIKCLAQGHYCHCQQIWTGDLTIESLWPYPLSHNSSSLIHIHISYSYSYLKKKNIDFFFFSSWNFMHLVFASTVRRGCLMFKYTLSWWNLDYSVMNFMWSRIHITVDLMYTFGHQFWAGSNYWAFFKVIVYCTCQHCTDKVWIEIASIGQCTRYSARNGVWTLQRQRVLEFRKISSGNTTCPSQVWIQRLWSGGTSYLYKLSITNSWLGQENQLAVLMKNCDDFLSIPR